MGARASAIFPELLRAHLQVSFWSWARPLFRRPLPKTQLRFPATASHWGRAGRTRRSEGRLGLFWWSWWWRSRRARSVLRCSRCWAGPSYRATTSSPAEFRSTCASGRSWWPWATLRLLRSKRPQKRRRFHWSPWTVRCLRGGRPFCCRPGSPGRTHLSKSQRPAEHSQASSNRATPFLWRTTLADALPAKSWKLGLQL